jgi:hypothetical protein
MTVSLGAAQELFWGVLKISLFFSAESNSINLGAFVNSIAYSQKLKIVVDFCTINLRSPSGMLMARKIWHAFFYSQTCSFISSLEIKSLSKQIE